MSTKKVPDRVAVEKLKQDWMQDGAWDLEAVEGFEAYQDELRAFSNNVFVANREREAKRIHLVSEKMGCPGNIELAQYIERLESTISRFEDRILKLEGY